MPLTIDWATGRDPLAFLTRWAESVGGQLSAGASRFVVEVAFVPRAQTLQPVVPAPESSLPTLIAPARFTDRVGVNVIDPAGGQTVAAVLFVAPDHKADSDAALAFAVRAAGLMSAGASVAIVDIVPGAPAWATHLHSLTGVYPIVRRPRGGEAPVLVVHPRVHAGAEQFAVWHHLVAAGFPLPTVRVPIRDAAPLELDLEATYLDACQQIRLPE